MTQPNDELIERIQEELSKRKEWGWKNTGWIKDAEFLLSQLQMTREENKRLTSVEHTLCVSLGEADKVIVKLQGEVFRLKRETSELVQVKVERDAYRDVLEGYAIMKLDGARTILSQYKKLCVCEDIKCKCEFQYRGESNE